MVTTATPRVFIEILDGKVLPLLTASLHAEKKAGARWTSVVTPKGLEGKSTQVVDQDNNMTTDDKRGEIISIDAHSRADKWKGGLTANVLATAARMLERALLAGDTPRALRIAAELRDMSGEPHALEALLKAE